MVVRNELLSHCICIHITATAIISLFTWDDHNSKRQSGDFGSAAWLLDSNGQLVAELGKASTEGRWTTTGHLLTVEHCN